MAQKQQDRAQKRNVVNIGPDLSHRTARAEVHRSPRDGLAARRDAQLQEPGSSDRNSPLRPSSGNGLRDSPPIGYGQESDGRYFRHPLAVEGWLSGTERVYGRVAHHSEGTAESRYQTHTDNQHEGSSSTNNVVGRATPLAQIGSQFDEE